jgi:hypothetical protein
MYEQYAPIIFWASDEFTLVAQRDLKVLLNTYQDRVHGEVMAEIQKTFLRVPDGSWDGEVHLDQLFVDVPLSTNFDQLTAMNLRLIAETIVQLSPEEQIMYDVNLEDVNFMQCLIQEMTGIPRESMKEVTKKMKNHSPLSVLKFMNSNARELKDTLKTAAADDFVIRLVT